MNLFLIPLLPVLIPYWVLRELYHGIISSMHRRDLTKIVTENPCGIESRKSDIAIKMNIDAEEFESAWQDVARAYPHLFPQQIAYLEEAAFCQSVQKLIDSPKRVITKRLVVQLSGLPMDRVEALWPHMHTYGLYLIGCFIEDEPPRPREGANKSYGTRAFNGNPLILND